MENKTHHAIDYIELPANDLTATEAFFNRCFDWHFTHYGEDYMDCNDGGLMIGFYRADLCSMQSTGGAMVTLYSHDIEASQKQVEDAGANITQALFSFPGGKRFQFTEPSGNELAIWTTET